MYDVIAVGSAAIDTFVNTRSELIKIIDHIGKRKKSLDFIAYPVGSKLLIKDLDFLTGGGGTNVAVAFSRLGLKTGYLGNLGSDSNAELILKELKKEKIKFIGTRSKGFSGFSVILDSIEHERTILAYKGANNFLDYKKINLRKLKTKWFYFTTMMQQSFKTQEKLAQFAEKNKIKVAFNPSSYLARKGAHYSKNIIKRTELLVLNDEEAGLLVGVDKTKEMIKKLHKLGPNMVVITEGKHGVHASDGKHLYSLIPHKIKVVEATGAGDAFTSSFLAGIVKRNNIEFALELGLTNAESVIQYYGAKNKLLTWKEALKEINKSKFKINKSKI